VRSPGVIFGRRKQPSRPSLDRLFALSAVYTDPARQLQVVSRGLGAVVFHPVEGAQFDQIVRRAQAAVRETRLGGDADDTEVESSNDPYAFRWLIFRNASFERLVAGVHAISTALEATWWDRLLCAVFSFEDDLGRPVYWVYNYKWGAFYPIAPASGNHHREVDREQLLSSHLDDDVSVQPERGVWFPLWGIPI
jgi:hypothetical protein